MTMVTNGEDPSKDNNISVGMLCFERSNQMKLWAVSDTNLKQQDWLDGTDQIAVPLQEPLKRGKLRRDLPFRERYISGILLSRIHGCFRCSAPLKI